MVKKSPETDNFMLSGLLLLVVLGITAWVLLPEPDTGNFGKLPLPKAAATRSQTPGTTPVRQAGARDPFREETPLPVSPGPGDEARKKHPVAAAPVDTRTAEQKLQAAVELVDQGDWTAAEGILKKLLAADPNNETALVELAMIELIDKKDSAAAIPYMEKVLHINPENDTIINELISVYEEEGRLSEGVEFLKKIANDGSNTAMDQGLARALMAMGNPDEAITFYTKAARTNDSFQRTGILEEMGDAWLQNGEVEQAQNAWRMAISNQELLVRESPEDPGTRERQTMLYYKLARSLMENGREEEGAAIMRDIEKRHSQWNKAKREKL